MKKVLIMMMCVIMVVCFMPTVAMAGTVDAEGAVASVITASGTEYYSSLKDAVANVAPGGTVNLLKDSCGDGIGTYLTPKPGQIKAKSMTINLNNNTYTIGRSAVGSEGYESQAFHFEWSGKADDNYNVTIQNGTITSSDKSGVSMLVQNYCNLTLDSVTLDGTNITTPTGWSQGYVLSNNCGTVNLIGKTDIKTKNGDVAFDVCRYASYPKTNVMVNTTGTIDGEIEVSHSGGDIADENSSLTIKAGNFDNFSIENQGTSIPIIINGGTF